MITDFWGQQEKPRKTQGCFLFINGKLPVRHAVTVRCIPDLESAALARLFGNAAGVAALVLGQGENPEIRQKMS